MGEGKEFIIIRTDFRGLEDVLNTIEEKYPLYSIFQILTENSYSGSLAVVILKKVVI
jgi:hypothetical protein